MKNRPGENSGPVGVMMKMSEMEDQSNAAVTEGTASLTKFRLV
jgi:hypothetical protein